ncbi:helix-hairpin-helix domain-containing protein [Micromonospora echinaurantiaca]|uniref:helix-hairpin-helix domain-containing protein n=1 Tax=Micromonospora echinaurantiaca TaxID=47857 RepID=UPI0037955478
MSNDEEVVVRQRLRRLLPATAAETAAPPAGRAAAGVAADPPGRSHTLAVPWPFAGASPGVGPDRAGGRPPAVDDGPLSGLGHVPIRAALPSRSASSVPDPEPVLVGGAGEDAPTSRLPGPGVFDPGRRGVRVLALVAVLVVLGAGFWAWRSRPRAEPVAPLATAVPAGPLSSSFADPVASPAGELVVAVAGKVRRPGLVRVPAGARVADAVEAAGGALPGVDVALLNPARKVTDGELILVGVPAPPNLAGAPAAPGAGEPGAAAGGRVNLNTATLAQLDSLPGVGPVLAQRILDHREQHGGFRSVGDLRQVDGIGDARYEQLKDLVTV